MRASNKASGRIDLTLTSEPIVVGRHTLYPVARLSGWRGHGGTAPNVGGGAFMRLRPVAVHVMEAGKADRTISIVDPTLQPLRTLAGVAFMIAAFFGMISLLVRRYGKE